MDALIKIDREVYNQPFARGEAVKWTPAESTANAMAKIAARFDKGVSASAFVANMREVARLTRTVRHGSHRAKVAARRALRTRYAAFELLTK